MASSINDAISGLTASMAEKGNDVFLDGYKVQLITECQNDGCDFEFDSPIVVLADELSTNQANVVCNDCPGEVESDNEEEISEEIDSHEQNL